MHRNNHLVQRDYKNFAAQVLRQTCVKVCANFHIHTEKMTEKAPFTELMGKKMNIRKRKNKADGEKKGRRGRGSLKICRIGTDSGLLRNFDCKPGENWREIPQAKY